MFCNIFLNKKTKLKLYIIIKFHLKKTNKQKKKEPPPRAKSRKVWVNWFGSSFTSSLKGGGISITNLYSKMGHFCFFVNPIMVKSESALHQFTPLLKSQQLQHPKGCRLMQLKSTWSQWLLAFVTCLIKTRYPKLYQRRRNQQLAFIVPTRFLDPCFATKSDIN